MTALDAMAEVFSDETSATSAAAKGCAPHTQRKNELTPLRSPQARHKCGQFGVLFSGD
jgi:ribosomal protein S10